jgi:hypothetical protein
MARVDAAPGVDSGLLARIDSHVAPMRSASRRLALEKSAATIGSAHAERAQSRGALAGDSYSR